MPFIFVQMMLIRTIHILFYGIILAIFTLFVVLFSILPIKIHKQVGSTLFRYWAGLFFKLFGIKENIHNENKMPLPLKYILISNHPSGIDLIWLPVKFDVIPLSKAEIKNWFLIGRIAAMAGTLFVKREDLVSRTQAARMCKDALDAGKNLLIFPEGGCRGKNVNSFLPGAFHISQKTNTPILPVFIYYEDEDSYEWGDYGVLKFIYRALFKPSNRNAHLFIYDPFNPGDYTDPEQFMESVHGFYLEKEKENVIK